MDDPEDPEWVPKSKVQGCPVGKKKVVKIFLLTNYYSFLTHPAV